MQNKFHWLTLLRDELLGLFKDQGVLIFCLLVPLGYPLLYAFIYTNEVVHEVPVAVVDDCRSAQSRDYLRRLDATAEVKIISHCANMTEAEALIRQREAYGAVYIPRDFSRRLARGEQVAVSAYADLGGMLYYKAVLTANTNVSLDMNAEIKVERAGGTTAEEDRVAEHPIRYEEVSLFNPQTGFAAFLIPAVLMLIIQQTLLLGVGMAAGTAREKNNYGFLVPIHRRYRGVMRIVWGKAMAYLMIYVVMAAYLLCAVPYFFNFISLVTLSQLALFSLPYLLSCIFFSMTLSVMMRYRENVMLLVVFSSVMLLFMSGVSWPQSNIPAFWQGVSWLFPSTFGIRGFVRMNSMGATLTDVSTEYRALWIQTIVYFVLAHEVYRFNIAKARHAIHHRLLHLRSKAVPSSEDNQS